MGRDENIPAHIDLKKDKGVVLAAVKQHGWALEFAHDDFKKDNEVVVEQEQKEEEDLHPSSSSFYYYAQAPRKLARLWKSYAPAVSNVNFLCLGESGLEKYKLRPLYGLIFCSQTRRTPRAA